VIFYHTCFITRLDEDTENRYLSFVL
jgi:hypothetical protein